MIARVSGIPVLNYHGVGSLGIPEDAPDRKFWVSASTLRQQLAQVRYSGRRVVLLSQHWGHAPARPEGGRSVVITFDDGRVSDYDVAFPLLVQAGARAEFFINTANIGRAGFMTWAHVEEMQRAGMSFQSHAHDHIVLLGLSRPRLEYQLRTSKQRLEDHLSRSVQFVAAPYGLLGRRVIATAEQVGYRGVCNSRQWLAQPGSRVINRVAVHAHTTGKQFIGLLEARPAAYLPGYGRMALTQLPKRVLLKMRPSLLGVALAPEGA